MSEPIDFRPLAKALRDEIAKLMKEDGMNSDIKVGDRIKYHYHTTSKDKKVTSKKEYFGFCVAVDRPGEAFTVIWWDDYGAQFSNREAKVGTGHRQFEKWED